MDLPILAAAAATAASIANLDAKYNVMDDLKAPNGIKVHTAKVARDLYRRHGESDGSLYHLIDNTYTRLESDGSKKEALLFEGRSWSYHDLVTDIVKIERKFKELDVQCGDLVAMMINNSPEFIITIFALWKIGAIPAPVNTSLTSDPLKYCLAITYTNFIMTTNELLPAIATTLQGYATKTPNITILCYDYTTYHALPSYHSEVAHIQHSTFPPGSITFNNRPTTPPKTFVCSSTPPEPPAAPKPSA